jgi:hypothetical protein
LRLRLQVCLAELESRSTKPRTGDRWSFLQPFPTRFPAFFNLALASPRSPVFLAQTRHFEGCRRLTAAGRLPESVRRCCAVLGCIVRGPRHYSASLSSDAAFDRHPTACPTSSRMRCLVVSRFWPLTTVSHRIQLTSADKDDGGLSGLD